MKRRRPQRPTRHTLEQLLRETDGNISRLAGLLDISRPTLYEWIYQLDLASIAGIASVSNPDELYSSDSQAQENTGRSVKPQAQKGRKFQLVSSQVAVAADPRVNTSVRIRASIWKRMRKLAIDENRPVAELMEEAAAAYLERGGADSDAGGSIDE